ncbi:MAG: nitrite/sulfite reductase hemoprotein beta-component ferrodoxin domain protein, partial [Pseudonocardia sp.]|nr:nitrite/sulfite reductase hemoprotein beta-component ferrodoxin domain protein [Pseudonocardia sp.]
ATALRAVADCAQDLGDGRVHLTSRGNLQLRGLSRASDLAARLGAAGLLPSPAHERVRNVLASPLSGIAGGCADVRCLAAELDRELCHRLGLARLPGRFLFALDDGRGDVAAEEPDVCWHATCATSGELLVAGVAIARVGLTHAVGALLDAAEAFLTLRAADGGTAWRATELPDAPARIAAALAAMEARSELQESHLHATWLHERGFPATARPGPVRRDDGGIALVVAAVLGELTADQVRLLATTGPRVVVTPWRTVVLPDPLLPVEQLVASGLLVAPGVAATVSACIGRPGCAKSLADVRTDARAALAHLPDARMHVSGCPRRCGAPRAVHVDALALPDGGYLVDGVPRPGLVP